MSMSKQLYASGADEVKINFQTFVRVFLNEKRWFVLVSTILIPLLITLVTGSDVFRGEAPTKKGAFAFICACIWIGLFNSAQKICKERATVDAGFRSGQKMSAYVIAQMLFELCLCVFETIVVSAIILFKFAHNTTIGVCIGLVITLFLVIYSSDVLGLLISSVVKTAQQAMTVMPILLIIQLIFAGCIFTLEGISETLSAYTISRWGYEAILNLCDLPVKTSFWFNKEMSTPFFMCWIYLIVFAGICGVLTAVVLRFVHYDHR